MSDHSYDSSDSKFSFETPSSSSNVSTPSLPTPTPIHEPTPPGYTPVKKKAKRALFLSPRTKGLLEDMHHNQREQINLQREQHYEQQVTSQRLGILEAFAIRFCGMKSPKKDVVEPSRVSTPRTSTWNPWESSYSYHPSNLNSWERQNLISPKSKGVEIIEIDSDK